MAPNPLVCRLGGMTAVVAMTDRRALRAGDDLRPNDLISAADAASIAGRSIRTIRRAYRAGKLLAYRDGNGHGVRIRYSDLLRWMTAQAVGPSRKAGPRGSNRPAGEAGQRQRKECGASPAIASRCWKRAASARRQARFRFRAACCGLDALSAGLNGSPSTDSLACLHSCSKSMGSVPV